LHVTAADAERFERAFRRAGLPTLVEDRSAREDVWTRATPLLLFVLLGELLIAGNLAWPWWQNALALAAALAALLAVLVALNRVRGRPGLARPRDIGGFELAAFVVAGGVMQLVGGQPTSAAVVLAVNAGVLALAYGWIVYGLGSILRFAGWRVGRQLSVALDLLARAIPLLLLFSLVLFINTEMWQVFSGMDDPTFAAAIALLVLAGTSFLAVRLPREVRELEQQVGAEPRLSRRQRVNVGLVLFVSQALQVLVVAAAVGAFFVLFGSVAVSAEVMESWIGSPGSGLVALEPLGVDVRITEELLRISGGIAALCGLYYSVAVLTDGVYRDEFLEDVTGDLRVVFADRAAYLQLRAGASAIG
jgi:hypothetical protein